MGPCEAAAGGHMRSVGPEEDERGRRREETASRRDLEEEERAARRRRLRLHGSWSGECGEAEKWSWLLLFWNDARSRRGTSARSCQCGLPLSTPTRWACAGARKVRGAAAAPELAWDDVCRLFLLAGFFGSSSTVWDSPDVQRLSLKSSCFAVFFL
jgi:hypothetical protein